jgi:hypothetical protein
MAMAIPQYPRKQVVAAGEVLLEGPANPDYDRALTIINNWRASHGYPLKTFRKMLRRYSLRSDPEALLAQRIKRLSSIELKLRRFPTMKLIQMQDLGGCRAIVNSIQAVESLVTAYKGSTIRHKLVSFDDYILAPKASGYRGVHLIYRYYSTYAHESYNGLKIEIQLRTDLQHAWATAVETVGTFIRQALKSSQGEERWLRFFALMGTAIAWREKGAAVPGTPTNRAELIRELKKYMALLDVENRLQAYGAALKFSQDESADKGAKYFLLELRADISHVRITGYRNDQLEEASSAYLEAERSLANNPASEAVLVSVDSLAALHRAYPNYFLDTRLFIDAVKRAAR